MIYQVESVLTAVVANALQANCAEKTLRPNRLSCLQLLTRLTRVRFDGMRTCRGNTEAYCSRSRNEVCTRSATKAEEVARPFDGEDQETA